ncbi:MAG: hypothetical protein GVY27_10915 [Deinococcus-Thermus bacterium]|jgi:lysozyme|nr:hypothetical protein [Deinococcota bacterium]
MADDRDAFAAFCAGLGLEHFKPAELLTKCERPGNAVPPRQLWPNIVPTILVLDRLRAAVGAPIVILSGYRAPDYNRKVGGAATSQHLAFTALDVACSGVDPDVLHAKLRAWRGEAFESPIPLDGRGALDTPAGPTPFKPLTADPSGAGAKFVWHGGLGLYETFVHLDTRGYDADW